MASERFVDYYDLLSLDLSASLELVEASIRILLQRYGQQNKETADAEKLEVVKKAYLVLSDRQNRAQYDRDYKQRRTAEGTAANAVVTPETVRAEIRKRLLIVKVLYEQMMKDSHSAALTAIGLSQGVGVPIERLQFSLWFLKEKGLLIRNDQGDYCITADGVEWLERHSLPQRSGEPARAKQAVNGEVRPVTKVVPQVERRSIASASEQISSGSESAVDFAGPRSA